MVKRQAFGPTPEEAPSPSEAPHQRRPPAARGTGLHRHTLQQPQKPAAALSRRMPVRDDGVTTATLASLPCPSQVSEELLPAGQTPQHQLRASAHSYAVTCSPCFWTRICQSPLRPWGNREITAKTTPRSLGTWLTPGSDTASSRLGRHLGQMRGTGGLKTWPGC